MTSPWNAEKKICLLFGLWPQGTLAAVDGILKRCRPAKLANQFRGALKRQQNVIAILRITITGLLQGTGEFVKVRVF
jgi:hypothetical protein